jgi:uncharacterized protein (DUF58 family)
LGRLSLTSAGFYYLVVLAFVAAGAMLQQINLLLLLLGLMLGILIFNALSVLTILRGAQVVRRVPESLVAGDPLVVEVELTNRGRYASLWAVSCEDDVRIEGIRGPRSRFRPSVLFVHVPARQNRLGFYRGQLLRRGLYNLGPLRLSTRFPFGLVKYSIDIPDRRKLLVYPQMGTLTPSWHRLTRSTFDPRTPRASQRRGPMEGEFHGLRPWRDGDSPRWVHWRSTARAGELTVRQFEQPQTQDLVLLVDLWLPPRPDRYDREAVERAVSFAATVMSELYHRGGSHCLLGLTAPRPLVLSGPVSRGLLESWLARLATARANDDGRRLATLLATCAPQTRVGQQVVLVTTRNLEPERSTDAKGPGSLADVPRDTPAGELLARAVCLDAGSQQLEEYFVVPH